jgi:acyl carrier protein
VQLEIEMAWLSKFKVIPANSGDDVESVVRATIEQFLNAGTPIRRSHNLLVDLKLDSDDLTLIALMLEKSYGVLIPRARYGNVHTVADLIALLDQRHQ